MSRDPSGIYSYPDGTRGSPETTIFSARYNTFIDDLAVTLNSKLPINMGGTAGATAVEARDNLNAEVAGAKVTNYDMHVFENGSFYSDSGATGSPDETRYFVGTARLLGSNPTNEITLEVHTSDAALPALSYKRQKLGGVWGPWTTGGVATVGGITGIGDETADMYFGLAGTSPTSSFVVNTKGDASGTNIFSVSKPGGFLFKSDFGSTVMTIDATPGSYNDIYFSNIGAPRFLLRQDGSNTLSLFTFNDSLEISTTALSIDRYTGRTTVPEPTAAGHIATKDYVDTTTIASAGDTMTGALIVSNDLNVRYSTGIIANATPDPKLRVESNAAGDAAYMAFVRTGIFAGLLGLDTDNTLKYGGWTNGALAWRVVHEGLSNVSLMGNFTVNGGDLFVNSPGSGSSRVILRDEASTYRAQLTWDRSTSNFLIGLSGVTNFIIDIGGIISLSNGFRSKAGVSGGYGTTCHNFNWTGGLLQAWVDATNVGNITLTSDYRIKKDVADLPAMWDTVKAMRPISYTQAAYASLFVADDIERWGFIAHELQETLTPSVASGVKDQPDAVQALRIDGIVAALTKALQEAMARIEALEAKL